MMCRSTPRIVEQREVVRGKVHAFTRTEVPGNPPLEERDA